MGIGANVPDLERTLTRGLAAIVLCAVLAALAAWASREVLPCP